MLSKEKNLARFGIVKVNDRYKFCLNRLIFQGCDCECEKICSSSPFLVPGKRQKFYFCQKKAGWFSCGTCPGLHDCERTIKKQDNTEN